MHMKSAAIVGLALAATAQATVQGFDISDSQPIVDFEAARDGGARFVIIKATEGTNDISRTFSSQYEGASSAGLIRGAYHVAHLGETPGAVQAYFFASHSGGWSGDGITLPGMLDLESGLGAAQCWGLSPGDIVAWIMDFSDTYLASTTRYPMIYTSPSWWQTCTGDSDAFANTNPLVLAHYGGSVGPIPGGWPTYAIWQYSDSYAYGGDADLFNGEESDLHELATG